MENKKDEKKDEKKEEQSSTDFFPGIEKLELPWEEKKEEMPAFPPIPEEAEDEDIKDDIEEVEETGKKQKGVFFRNLFGGKKEEPEDMPNVPVEEIKEMKMEAVKSLKEMMEKDKQLAEECGRTIATLESAKQDLEKKVFIFQKDTEILKEALKKTEEESFLLKAEVEKLKTEHKTEVEKVKAELKKEVEEKWSAKLELEKEKTARKESESTERIETMKGLVIAYKAMAEEAHRKFCEGLAAGGGGYHREQVRKIEEGGGYKFFKRLRLIK